MTQEEIANTELDEVVESIPDSDYSTVSVWDRGLVESVTVSEEENESDKKQGVWIVGGKDEHGFFFTLKEGGVYGDELLYEVVKYEHSDEKQEFLENVVDKVEDVFEMYNNDNLPKMPE